MNNQNDIDNKENNKCSEERKQQISDFMKERHASVGHPMQGKHHTDDAKQRISNGNKGKVISEEHKKIISETHKTPEDKEKLIIEAYLNNETIKSITSKYETSAMSVYRILKRNGIDKKGPVRSWEGRSHSEETKQKMSEYKTNYWKNVNGETNE